MVSDVIVEVNDNQNRNLQFLPLGERVRGRFDVMRMAGEIGPLRTRFPMPIPGQRIGLNVKEQTGYLLEPLHDPENAAIKEQVEKSAKLAPAVRTVEGIDVKTWAYWLGEAVKQGLAEVVEGTLPKVNGTPQTRFHSVEHLDPMDRLADAIERQCTLMGRILERLAE